MNPPVVARATDVKPIKFGILGAANIVSFGLTIPAKSHPEVVVYAVAARDKSRAETFAKKHGIEKVYGGPNGYQGSCQGNLCQNNTLFAAQNC